LINYTYIGPISQLITFEETPLKGALHDDGLAPKKNQGILMKNGRIEAVDDHGALFAKAEKLKAKIYGLPKKSTVLPGFIDSHTHICFSGDRALDYARRNAGMTYLEIAEKGGGIWDTVTHTRNAGQQELAQLTAQRANLLLSRGITTIEVKSGYGQSIEEELKMLRAIAQAQKLTKATLVPTCLALHIIPREFKGKAEKYVDTIVNNLLPIIKEENLAARVDAFIEQGSYTPLMVKPFFEKARESNLDITVHADQFTTGGSKVAINYEAVSADHLEASGEVEIALLAQSNTVATALPGATLGLGCGFAPARRLLDQGACLAIASDWNPGSAPMGDLLTQASILGAFEKLTSTEILTGMTYRAAHALRREKIGRIRPGYAADIVVFETGNPHEVLYRQGQLRPSKVFKNGELIQQAHDI
tara:strand:+ start:4828 stop:6084 length:1257 start_codon:yes stop_codon:yes gene_type:complete